MTRSDVMKELKNTREIIYAKNNETADYVYNLQRKTEADMEYLAMMADVDMSEDEEEEVEE